MYWRTYISISRKKLYLYKVLARSASMFSDIQLLSSETHFRNFHICWDICCELDFDFLDSSKVFIYDIGMLILRLVPLVKVICKVNNINGIRYNKKWKNTLQETVSKVFKRKIKKIRRILEKSFLGPCTVTLAFFLLSKVKFILKCKFPCDTEIQVYNYCEKSIKNAN